MDSEANRKCERIINILGEAHDYFIDEAQPTSRQAKERRLSRLIPLAACLTVCVMVAVFFAINGVGKQPGNQPGTSVVWRESLEGEEFITKVDYKGHDVRLRYIVVDGHVVSVEAVSEGWAVFGAPYAGAAELGGRQTKTFGKTVVLSKQDQMFFEVDYRTGEVNDFTASLSDDDAYAITSAGGIETCDFFNGQNGGSIAICCRRGVFVLNVADGSFRCVSPGFASDIHFSGIWYDGNDEILSYVVSPPGADDEKLTFMLTEPAPEKGDGVRKWGSELRYDAVTGSTEGVCSMDDIKAGYNGSVNIRWEAGAYTGTPTLYTRRFSGVRADGGDLRVVWFEAGGKVTGAYATSIAEDYESGDELYTTGGIELWLVSRGIGEIAVHVLDIEGGAVGGLPEHLAGRILYLDGEYEFRCDSGYDYDSVPGVSHRGGLQYALFDGVNVGGYRDSFYFDGDGRALVISELVPRTAPRGVRYKGELKIAYGELVGAEDDEYVYCASLVQSIHIRVYGEGGDVIAEYEYDVGIGKLVSGTTDIDDTTPDDTTSPDAEAWDELLSRIPDRDELTFIYSDDGKKALAYDERRAYYMNIAAYSMNATDKLLSEIAWDIEDHTVEVWDADYGPVSILTVTIPPADEREGVSELCGVYAYDRTRGALEKADMESVPKDAVMYTRYVDYDGGIRIYWCERGGEIVSAGKVLELVGESSRNTYVDTVLNETREVVINYVDQSSSDLIICSVDTGALRDILDPIRDSEALTGLGTYVSFDNIENIVLIENRNIPAVYLYDLSTGQLACLTDFVGVGVGEDGVDYFASISGDSVIIDATYPAPGAKDGTMMMSVSVFDRATGKVRRVVDHGMLFYKGGSGDSYVSPIPEEGVWMSNPYGDGGLLHYLPDVTYRIDILTGERTELPAVNAENANMDWDELLEAVKDKIGKIGSISFSFDYNKVIARTDVSTYYYDTVSGVLVDIGGLPEVTSTETLPDETLYCLAGFRRGSNDTVTVEVRARSDKYTDTKLKRVLCYRADENGLTFVGEGTANE